MDWKPIKSAPRDGSLVMVCRAGGHIKDDVEFCRNHSQHPTEGGGADVWIDKCAEDFDAPTHWTEIPWPPQ